MMVSLIFSYSYIQRLSTPAITAPMIGATYTVREYIQAGRRRRSHRRPDISAEIRPSPPLHLD
jgi:hypothetical protein